MPNQTHKSSQSRLTDMPNQACRYAKSGSQICQIRLKIMPNQAHKYAKSGSRLCQIRLNIKPNQAHMPHKRAKPGIQGQIRRPLPGTLERKSSYPWPFQSRTKASDTPTTRRSKLGVKTRKLNAL